MEQVLSLINRLEQQLKQGVAAPELLATTSLLKAQVQTLCGSSFTQQESVAVWLPAGYKNVQAKPVVKTAPLAELEVSAAPLVQPVVFEAPIAAPATAPAKNPVQVAEPIEIPFAAEVRKQEPLFVPTPPRAPLVVEVSKEPVHVPVTAPPPPAEERVYAEGPVIFQLDIPEEEADKEAEAPVAQAAPMPQPAMPAPVTVPEAKEAVKDNRPFPQYPDVETLMKNIFPAAPAAKASGREINEMMGNPVTALNTRLAAATDKKVELAEVLVTGSKIVDLRKAISINEKYQMINGLFRGDEDMFERSVRTLNNFGSLPEARFWMQRELILKLGWNEEDQLVKHFHNLVNRRFS